MKIYRYTIVAYEEIDIMAENKEEADKKVQTEWDLKFRGMFGGPEYEGIIED